MIEKQKKRRFELGLGVFLNTGLAIVFASAAVFFIHQVNVHGREQAVAEAEAKAKLILDRNLATHAYFSHSLKPKVFDLMLRHGGDLQKHYINPGDGRKIYCEEISQYFKSEGVIKRLGL